MTYRIQYKGEDIPITTWRTVAPGKKGKYGFFHYKYKSFKYILHRFRHMLYFGYDEFDIKVYEGSRLVVEVIPYKDPEHWEFFRVRFYTNPRETKELVKLIKEDRFNVRTASG